MTQHSSQLKCHVASERSEPLLSAHQKETEREWSSLGGLMRYTSARQIRVLIRVCGGITISAGAVACCDGLKPVIRGPCWDLSRGKPPMETGWLGMGSDMSLWHSLFGFFGSRMQHHNTTRNTLTYTCWNEIPGNFRNAQCDSGKLIVYQQFSCGSQNDQQMAAQKMKQASVQRCPSHCQWGRRKWIALKTSIYRRIWNKMLKPKPSTISRKNQAQQQCPQAFKRRYKYLY